MSYDTRTQAGERRVSQVKPQVSQPGKCKVALTLGRHHLRVTHDITQLGPEQGPMHFPGKIYRKSPVHVPRPTLEVSAARCLFCINLWFDWSTWAQDI